ncbi:hypothetical protein PQR39_43520 [Paraburkholderia sediminicola]
MTRLATDIHQRSRQEPKPLVETPCRTPCDILIAKGVHRDVICVCQSVNRLFDQAPTYPDAARRGTDREPPDPSMRRSTAKKDAAKHAGTVVRTVGADAKRGPLSYLLEKRDFEIRHRSEERFNFTHDFEP